MNQGIKPTPSDYRRWTLLGLLVLCFIIRLSAFSGSKNFAYDAVIRTEIAQAWSKASFVIPAPQLQFPPQYSPLPIYLYGLGLKLIPNPQITPRLVSLLFSTLTLVPFYFLMEILYDRRKAVISSLFFCSYTLSVKSAVLASSESVFCFFLLVSIWLLYRYKSTSSKSLLVWSVLFMNLAAMSRYNGWLYIPLATLLIPEDLKRVSRRELTPMLAFFTGCLILPMAWMYCCWRVYGDFLYPLRFILADHLRVIAQAGPTWSSWANKIYLLFFGPGVLFLSLTPLVAVLALMGMGNMKKLRWGMHPLILSVVPLTLIFARVLFASTFFPMARFLTDGGFFLLGYAAVGYEEIEALYRRRWLPVIVGVSVVLSILALVAAGFSDIPKLSSKVRSVSPLSRLEPTQERISSYLKKHMSGDEMVVLDSYRGWSEIEIMFYSSRPRSHFLTRWRRRSQLTDWINMLKPRYLVTGPGGRAWDLVIDERLWSKTGFKPILLFKGGRQNVYRLAPFTSIPRSGVSVTSQLEPYSLIFMSPVFVDFS